MGENLSWVNGGHAAPKFYFTFPAYLELVRVKNRENPSWRKGQTYFNVLSDVRPELAEQIRGTQIDPFHRDCVLGAFLSHVATMW